MNVHELDWQRNNAGDDAGDVSAKQPTYTCSAALAPTLNITIRSEVSGLAAAAATVACAVLSHNRCARMSRSKQHSLQPGKFAQHMTMVVLAVCAQMAL